MGTLDGDRPQTLSYQRQADQMFGRLTKKEIEAIRAKARANIENELKDKEEARLLKEFELEERRAHDPKEEEHPIFLDLAPSMPHIMLDGTQYRNGHLYYVKASVFAVLGEQMNRGWAHEEVTQVRNSSGQTPARRPSHVGTGNFMDNRQPRNMRVSSSAMLGASANQMLGIGA